MNAVEKVIFDALAARRSIVLPGVGSLEVKRRRPKRISDTEILPPANVGVFTHAEPEGVATIVAILAERSAIPQDEAWGFYNEWLEGARRGEGEVVIEGVGEIRDGHFEGSEALAAALNPAGEKETVVMEKRRRGGHEESADDGGRKCGKLWTWILIGAVALTLIIVCLWFCCPDFRDGLTDGWKNVRKEQVVAPVEVPVAEPIVNEPIIEPVPVGPTYHVIAGAFAVESNADRMVETVKRNHPELSPKKFRDPRTGYNMVSIFDGQTEREAYNVMNRYWDIDLYMWVYKL